MNVLLISQCHKNALKETRRILDQFAERRGDRTWQTAVTQQGLDTLCKLLRKTARKNTAIACHWIHGKDHSELLWIVGDARQFNEQGAVPTNITRRNILRTADENDWHTQEDIRLLTELAALLHDIGKANEAFQNKLKTQKHLADAYRHEWVSLRMFEAFVNGSTDDDWLQRLSEITHKIGKTWLSSLKRDGIDGLIRSPFKTLPPFASTLGWLIISHHRLPLPDQTTDAELKGLPASIPHSWCGSRTDVPEKDKANCWKFKQHTPFVSESWCTRVRALVQKILARPQIIQTNWLDNPFVLHLSRLGLMLADHYFSSQLSQGRYGDKDFPLYANTQNDELNQRLDEHLVGVQTHASRIIRSLPYIASQLPRIARHKGFSRRSKDERFRWQDRAYDLAVSLQEKSHDHGFFGVNMASTGCGKTLANGRIMYGLSNPQEGARFNVALGLRTLTLQTGDAYRNRMGLGDDAMAVLVGGGTIRELHENLKEDPKVGIGTESSESLMPDLTYVHFEGALDDGPINRWLTKNTEAKKLLSAPVLVCTIDHLIPATECTRGGHQIPPMLRLMSSDLVLDEPDDFDVADLPALARLVNWAGMLGSRVLLSSATLPPAIINGLFQAYAKGRECYQQNRGQVGQRLSICCAWVDEFSTHTGDCPTAEEFEKNHAIFVDQRIKQLNTLAKSEQRRKATIQPISIATNTRERVCATLTTDVIHPQIHHLHTQHHSVDPITGKRVSFGLVRLANIQPLVLVAKELYQLGANPHYRIHLCVYHSQHPLLVRSLIEKKLDSLLNRNKTDDVFFDNAYLRTLLDDTSRDSQITDEIFLVLGTAVTEVGRDHDYDWAIVEPSSMRSIIQLAGRVRRHRKGNISEPNLCLLNTNIRHLEGNSPSFCMPGFESKDFRLDTHSLTTLLAPEQLSVIDASSRIREREALYPTSNIVDLEHARLRDLMVGAEGEQQQIAKKVPLWWETRVHLSAYLQVKQRFRNSKKRERYWLNLEGGDIVFQKQNDAQNIITCGNLKKTMLLEQGSNIQFWGAPDYREAVTQLAEILGIDEVRCTQRYGYLDLRQEEEAKGWRYHAALGFSRA